MLNFVVSNYSGVQICRELNNGHTCTQCLRCARGAAELSCMLSHLQGALSIAWWGTARPLRSKKQPRAPRRPVQPLALPILPTASEPFQAFSLNWTSRAVLAEENQRARARHGSCAPVWCFWQQGGFGCQKVRGPCGVKPAALPRRSSFGYSTPECGQRLSE